MALWMTGLCASSFGESTGNCYQSAMTFVTGQPTFCQLLDTPQQNGKSDTALPQDGPSKAEIVAGKKSELGGQTHKQETSNGVVETIGPNHSQTPTDIRGQK